MNSIYKTLKDNTMDNKLIDNFTTQLNVLLKKHQEEQTLESYYAVCEQLNEIGNQAEELIIEYVE